MNKNKSTILTDTYGCDFVVKLPSERRGGTVKILQLTDPQIIDLSQVRDVSKLPFSGDRFKTWSSDKFDCQCGNHIRSLMTQVKPDLVFMTGDLVYGRYDDNGTALKWLCELMDSFCVPWAPVFGNHDNEAEIGVDAQCQMFLDSKYCLFKRGRVTGNGNYSVGIAVGDELIRVIHMLDSNGCRHSKDRSVTKEVGLFDDQIALVENTAEAIREKTGANVPAFLAFHVPHEIFHEAEVVKGYVNETRKYYIIGVDVEAQDGDFGFKLDGCDTFSTTVDMAEFCHKIGVDGIFIGHHHNTATVINYKGIRLVFGLKTGQYDSYIPGNIGGTLITLYGGEYEVSNISSCCPYGPVPRGELRYKGFFQE